MVPTSALYSEQQVPVPYLYSVQEAVPPSPLLSLLPVCEGVSAPLFTGSCSPCSSAATAKCVRAYLLPCLQEAAPPAPLLPLLPVCEGLPAPLAPQDRQRWGVLARVVKIFQVLATSLHIIRTTTVNFLTMQQFWNHHRIYSLLPYYTQLSL